MSVVNGFVLHVPIGTFGHDHQALELFYRLDEEAQDPEDPTFELRRLEGFGGNKNYQADVYGAAVNYGYIPDVLTQIATAVERAIDDSVHHFGASREDDLEWESSGVLLLVYAEQAHRPAVYVLELSEPGSSHPLSWRCVLEEGRL